MASGPTILIIAGPNGAGKTTFARNILKDGDNEIKFLNADEIARGLLLKYPERATAILASRILLKEIEISVLQKEDFVIETTLSALTYIPKIIQWRKFGYQVHIWYLSLPDVEASIQSVKRRVARGGHDIP